MLTVGSTDRNDAASVFSSGSPGLDLAAPGENIPLQNPADTGYRVFSGTSFAAPMVAAAAAWVMTVRPELHVTQLFDVMRLSARDVAAPGYDERTGFGILDIPAALAHPAAGHRSAGAERRHRPGEGEPRLPAAKPPLNGPRGGAAQRSRRGSTRPTTRTTSTGSSSRRGARRRSRSAPTTTSAVTLLHRAHAPSLARSGGLNRLATGKVGRTVRADLREPDGPRGRRSSLDVTACEKDCRARDHVSRSRWLCVRRRELNGNGRVLDRNVEPHVRLAHAHADALDGESARAAPRRRAVASASSSANARPSETSRTTATTSR